MSQVRVRFAPSPTGPLHIGGVRTALYNYLFARKNKGAFILRIEDTDQQRYVPQAEQYIIDSLKWCGLEYDEGPAVGGPFAPYRQSERKAIYRQYADKLVESNHAYIAFDTSQEIEEMRNRLKTKENPSPQYDHASRMQMKNSLVLGKAEVQRLIDAGHSYVIRAKMPAVGDVAFNDLVRDEVNFSASLLDDKVLFKSDGMPTYHLANVVDDYLMKITHVIRGEEWLPSTPLHVLLYRFFGWEDVMPQFAHLPLILRPDGNGKLSKRDGDRLGFPVFPLSWKDEESGEESKGFRERGFLPEAFINMLVFLGWNPGTEQEIFSMNELVEAFSLERIVKSGAKFDPAKAGWFNQQYLRKKSEKQLAELLKPVLQEHGIERDEAFLQRFCGLLLDRVTLIHDFWEQGSYFFVKPARYDEKTLRKRWKPDSAVIFEKLIAELRTLKDFSAQSIDKFVHDFASTNNLVMGDILPSFRIMLTGATQGPAVFDIAALLGKEEVIARMKSGVEQFGKVLLNS